MNIASPQLGEELYSLSGWHSGDEWAPGIVGYGLGYLLRQMPANTQITKVTTPDGEWVCSIWIGGEFEDKDILFYGETPENAVCRLAIELFNKGVLKVNTKPNNAVKPPIKDEE